MTYYPTGESDTNDKVRWTCAHRYSALAALNDHLRHEYPSIQLPKFTSKKLFKNKEEVVDKRMRKLETYLDGLLKLPTVRDDKKLHSMLLLNVHVPDLAGDSRRDSVVTNTRRSTLMSDDGLSVPKPYKEEGDALASPPVGKSKINVDAPLPPPKRGRRETSFRRSTVAAEGDSAQSARSRRSTSENRSSHSTRSIKALPKPPISTRVESNTASPPPIVLPFTASLSEQIASASAANALADGGVARQVAGVNMPDVFVALCGVLIDRPGALRRKGLFQPLGGRWAPLVDEYRAEVEKGQAATALPNCDELVCAQLLVEWVSSVGRAPVDASMDGAILPASVSAALVAALDAPDVDAAFLNVVAALDTERFVILKYLLQVLSSLVVGSAEHSGATADVVARAMTDLVHGDAGTPAVRESVVRHLLRLHPHFFVMRDGRRARLHVDARQHAGHDEALDEAPRLLSPRFRSNAETLGYNVALEASTQSLLAPYNSATKMRAMVERLCDALCDDSVAAQPLWFQGDASLRGRLHSHLRLLIRESSDSDGAATVAGARWFVDHDVQSLSMALKCLLNALPPLLTAKHFGDEQMLATDTVTSVVVSSFDDQSATHNEAERRIAHAVIRALRAARRHSESNGICTMHAVTYANLLLCRADSFDDRANRFIGTYNGFRSMLDCVT